MPLHPLHDPSPAHDAPVVVQHRFQLGIELLNYRVTYDYSDAHGTVTVRVVQVTHADALMSGTLDKEEGQWILLADLDLGANAPTRVSCDWAATNTHGPLNEVAPIVAQALAAFFDHDALPSPMHRRVLRAMRAELDIAYDNGRATAVTSV